MSNISKILSLLILTIIFTGCGSKYINTQTLTPSLSNVQMKNIFVEEFGNDYIYQTDNIKQKIANNIIDNKKVFNLKNNHLDIDSIITGIVSPKLDIEPYYKEKEDSKICSKYIYDKQTKNKSCIEYLKRKIYCEKRDYSLKTSIEIVDKKGNIKFNKTYENSSYKQECFDNIPYFHHYKYSNLINREEDKIFRSLAEDIADDFLVDVSAHYISYKLYLIEELDDTLLYKKEDKKLYENLIEKIGDGKRYNILTTLKALDIRYGSHSHEILYIIGILYEKDNLFSKAIEYYKKALKVCKNEDNLELIHQAISRASRNISLKKQAISQLK